MSDPPFPKPGTAIGLVGCGRWGRYILRDLVALGCPTWVVARSRSSIENARSHGAHRIVDSVTTLPRTLDGYVVAVPTSGHNESIRELLDRDRPIFVEKPLTADPETAAELVEVAGERLFVMDKWRHHPAIEAMAELVRRGELGQPRIIRTRRIQWGSPHRDVDPVWILLPHELSIVLHVLGNLPQPIWAVSERAPGNGLVSLDCQLGRNPAAMVEVSAHAPFKERRVLLSCTHGAVTMVDPFADHVLVQRGAIGEPSAVAEKIPISTEFPLLRELRAFVAMLQGGPAPHSSAPDGLRVVRVCAQLRRMAARETL